MTASVKLITALIRWQNGDITAEELNLNVQAIEKESGISIDISALIASGQRTEFGPDAFNDATLDRYYDSSYNYR
jgi:hypothetical protein